MILWTIFFSLILVFYLAYTYSPYLLAKLHKKTGVRIVPDGLFTIREIEFQKKIRSIEMTSLKLFVSNLLFRIKFEGWKPRLHISVRLIRVNTSILSILLNDGNNFEPFETTIENLLANAQILKRRLIRILRAI